jgi:ABC-type cobalamin transport system permease subunit
VLLRLFCVYSAPSLSPDTTIAGTIFLVWSFNICRKSASVARQPIAIAFVTFGSSFFRWSTCELGQLSLIL